MSQLRIFWEIVRRMGRVLQDLVVPNLDAAIRRIYEERPLEHGGQGGNRDHRRVAESAAKYELRRRLIGFTQNFL
jgi:hypothetical protein